jgi:hypothetical protein
LIQAALRRRIAPLLLLAAGVVGYATLGPKLPRDHEVKILLGPNQPTVSALELVWIDPRNAERDAALTTRWQFTPGSAPRVLQTEVRLPNGPWDLDITLEHAAAPPSHLTRRIELEGSILVVHLDKPLQ